MRRLRRALGTVGTRHGLVVARKVFERRQATWIIVLEGPHEALRVLLPDWRPRGPSSRTQITPPQPLRRLGEFLAWSSTCMADWQARAQQSPSPTIVAETPPRPAYVNLGGLVAAATEEAALRVRAGSLTQYRTAWSIILRKLGSETPIAALTRDAAQRFLAEAAREYASTSVRNVFIALRLLVRRAIADGAILVDPLRGVQVAQPIRRDRDYLNREQRDRLLAEAARTSPDFHVLVALGCLAGLRKGELLALRWEDIDIAGRKLRIACDAAFTTKSGSSRTVPIGDDLLAILESHRRPSGYVVAPEKTHARGRYRWVFDRGFAGICRRAGLPATTSIHMLRHAFASIAAASNVSIFTLAGWMGHSATKTTEAYAHLAPGFDDAINRVGSGGTSGNPAVRVGSMTTLYVA
jgi:integrase